MSVPTLNSPAPTTSIPVDPASSTEFMPRVPETLAATGLRDTDVEPLVLKMLMNNTAATGREIAEQICLPFGIIEKLLVQMKADQSIIYKGSAQLCDYVYQLTDAGMEVARRLARHCSYCGAAPVPLEAYIDSVIAQSVTKQRVSLEDVAGVFSDLVVSSDVQERIGQALHAGRGFFIFGAPGNGKTTIAERVSRAFGQAIWIPKVISVNGEIIRLYDHCNHVPLPVEARKGWLDSQGVDRRWLRIRRPTIVAGGELTMNRLEISPSAGNGINEAPLQMKSNCGTLVIDDFGRQRVSADELLNRWIVPLDKGYDYLKLSNGRAIQVPFDQVLVFSTNLHCNDLVDEAFMRRIPYKIEVQDPTEEEFRELFRREARRLEVAHSEEAVSYVIRTHYLPTNRSLRCCHPRDLVLQVLHACQFRRVPAAMTPETIDRAVQNYFSTVS